MTHPHEKWHDIWDTSHSCVPWLIHTRHASFIWDMTRSYVPWLIHTRHASFIWDMTHSYATWLNPMRHDSFIRRHGTTYETRHIHVCYFQQSSAVSYTVENGTWNHPSTWDMTHSFETYLTYVCYLLFIWDMTHSWVISDMTHSWDLPHLWVLFASVRQVLSECVVSSPPAPSTTQYRTRHERIHPHETWHIQWRPSLCVEFATRWHRSDVLSYRSSFAKEPYN